MVDQIQGFEISPQQRRAWRRQRSSGGCAQCVIAIDGAADDAAIVEAIHLLEARFEILRTTFKAVPGMPYPLQVIADPEQRVIPCHDWRDAESLERHHEALWEKQRTEPFDFESGPLFQTELARIADDRRLLFLRGPALCLDAESMSLWMRLFARACAAAPDSEEETLQFADISQWLNETLESPESAEGIAFWTEKSAATDPSQTVLITSASSTGNKGVRSLHRDLPTELSARLNGCAAENDLTAADLVLACWLVLLWKHGGDVPVTVGTLFDGRNFDELAEAIGPLSKYLPLEQRLEPETTIGSLAGDLAGQLARMGELQEFFAWTESDDDSADKNVYAYCFEHHDIPEPVREGHLRFSMERFFVHPEPFALRLVCLEDGEGIELRFDFDSAAHTEAAVSILADQLNALLADTARDTARRIGDLSALGLEERARLTRPIPPKGLSETLIHQLFENSAARCPDNPAVRYSALDGESGRREITRDYAAVNGHANRLARHLRTLDVGPESLVGISINRSPETLVAILGVLKAGAAFVPLDPTYPAERIAYMIEDARLSLIVTLSAMRDAFDPDEIRCVCLDTDAEEIANQPATNPEISISPRNTAYVIYTSGSTGRPKGVAVTHRGMTNLAEEQSRLFDLEGDSRVLLFAPLNFDASVWEIIMPWRDGGLLCISPKNELLPGGPLESALRRFGITHVTLPPSALEPCEDEGLEKLQHIIVAGEACPVKTYLKWRLGRSFYNAYGPTETTVCSLVKNASEAMSLLPIGQPLANTQSYIVDEAMEPVPYGMAGQMVTSGPNLARGYLGKPGLTAERFTPHPFSDEPGRRIYQTGDRARLLVDGDFLFIGRIDNQVKIRGYRIELGEIEAVIGTHSLVGEAAVLAVSQGDSGPDQERLVAFVTPRGDRTGEEEPELDTENIRDHAKQKLPDYMVPALVVILDEMPLTPSGKIDRRALAAIDVRAAAKKKYVPPVTDDEKTLAEIFTTVLKVERVGLADNFFEIGGHSLLAMQVITRVRDAFGVSLSLRSLFEAPTIPELVLAIEALQVGDRVALDGVEDGEEMEDVEELSI